MATKSVVPTELLRANFGVHGFKPMANISVIPTEFVCANFGVRYVKSLLRRDLGRTLLHIQFYNPIVLRFWFTTTITIAHTYI
jgi:hypothetical protein